MKLKIDPQRLLLNKTPFAVPTMETGICVRALDPSGDTRTVDITVLDRDSLVQWLRSDDRLAERVLLVLLDHETRIEPEES